MKAATKRHYAPHLLPRRKKRVAVYLPRSLEFVAMVRDLRDVIEADGGTVANMGRAITLLRARGWTRL